MASDSKDDDKSLVKNSIQKNYSSQRTTDLSSGGSFLIKEAKSEVITGMCTCLACNQPSAFTPFKNNTPGMDTRILPYSTVSSVGPLSDYVYIPKGWSTW